MPVKDVAWMKVGASMVVGPSERADYEAAFAAAGYSMAEPQPAPEYGTDAVKFTRTA